MPIVRSTANISNGACTRWSNFFHGIFMLLAVCFCASYINQIPLAALAALLVFTGFRLASPRVFKEAYEIGIEQLLIFLATVVATLTTDLLFGVAAGIATKFAFHLFRGVPLRSLFRANLELSNAGDDTVIVRVKDSAIFSNFLSLKWQLSRFAQKQNLIVDLSAARLVDHTVMERLYDFSKQFGKSDGKSCRIIGLDLHKAASVHPFSAHILVQCPSERGERTAH